MHVIVEFCIVPLGIGVSLSKYIAVCEEELEDAGLKVELHANGTNIEGDWDEVMAAVKKCHQRIHEMGAPRIVTNLRIGTRTDRQQTLGEKVQSVQQKMQRARS
ncbi:MAG: MTH1187 family thiamine-binding protein [Acidobacteriota bacterium]|nr:MTH1187 family thiamine-binding protein [Acidobacteriota bacterium]